MVEAAAGTNLSLRTSGSGRVTVNGDEVRGAGQPEHHGAELAARLERMETRLARVDGEQGRVAELETQLASLSQTDSGARDMASRLLSLRSKVGTIALVAACSLSQLLRVQELNFSSK